MAYAFADSMIGGMRFSLPLAASRTRVSAACTDDARWGVHWRNPRIHGEDRVKTWAACDAHRDSLAAWLRSRAFPVAVTAFGETVERVA